MEDTPNKKKYKNASRLSYNRWVNCIMSSCYGYFYPMKNIFPLYYKDIVTK